MDHYLEIRVLPDPEFSEEMLMAALVAKLHRALGKEGRGILGSASRHMALSPAPSYACTVIIRH
jgi:CRISPR-associated endonuclease Csy4